MCSCVCQRFNGSLDSRCLNYSTCQCFHLLDTFQNEKTLGDSLQCERDHSSKYHWRQWEGATQQRERGFLLTFPRSWGKADESYNYRGACSVCVLSHITWQGKTGHGQAVICWTSESGCYIFEDVTCVFHPHSLQKLCCAIELWRGTLEKVLFAPRGNVFCCCAGSNVLMVAPFPQVE